jgi:hypothetical protein
MLACLMCMGCAAEEARIAARGKSAVLGFTPDQMRMCAGFPGQVVAGQGVEIWSYKRDAPQSGGIAVSSPLSVVPGLSQTLSVGAPSSTCSMQVRFREGKVIEVAYAGDTRVAGISHANCAPLIASCIDYAAHR